MSTPTSHNTTNGGVRSYTSTLVSPMQNLSLGGSGTRTFHTTIHTTQTTHQSEPETSEVEDGPSFREALKAFQSKSTTTSANQSPLTPRQRQSNTSAEQLLQSTSQRIERTIQQTTTNRSYHIQDR